MNRKTILAVFFLVVCLVGIGIFAALKYGGYAVKSEEPDTATTTVTVQTGALRLATLHRYIQGYGTIEPAPGVSNLPPAYAAISTPVAGIITKVAVVEGQRVEKGDTLAELNSATMTADYAAQLLERQKTLYAEQNTSLKSLQDAEVQLALLRVTSPLSGTAVRVNITPGQAVDSTTVVAVVTDLNRLVVNAEIPAANAVSVESGDPLDLLTAPPVTTELSYVSSEVNKSNDTVLVRGLLPPNHGLRPGQFIPLRIVAEVHTDCLAAPQESVVTDDSGNSIIALVRGDEAVATPVKIGLRENGWAEVQATGLKPGDIVVTVGSYGLPDKSKIRIQNSPGDETPAK